MQYSLGLMFYIGYLDLYALSIKVSEDISN